MIAEITSLIKTSKSAVSLLKEIRNLIPNAGQQSEISERILQVEKDLELAESTTAKELGYDLCQCTFPPQIMLYQKDIKSTVCPICSHSKSKGTTVAFSE